MKAESVEKVAQGLALLIDDFKQLEHRVENVEKDLALLIQNFERIEKQAGRM